jgi:hypothetical protein
MSGNGYGRQSEPDRRGERISVQAFLDDASNYASLVDFSTLEKELSRYGFILGRPTSDMNDPANTTNIRQIARTSDHVPVGIAYESGHGSRPTEHHVVLPIEVYRKLK